MAVVFNTHDAVKALKGSGFTEQQAEGLTVVMSDIVYPGLATKSDLNELRMAMNELRTELRSEIRVAVADVKSDILFWAFGVVVVQSGIFAAMLKFFH